eukprot:scaffold1827_cov167-Amphora_coffeaeformis.AAC.6
MEIPVDEHDNRFSKSYDVPDSDEAVALAQKFFDEYGFVIFRDVISRDECTDLINDMVVLLQERCPDTVDPNNPRSWATALSHFGCPKGVNALFRPSLLRLRQNSNVNRSFATVLGTDQLVVSHDRWLLHRPPPSTSQALTKRNLHLDMNPWEFHGDEAARTSILNRLSKLSYGTNDRAFIAENNDVHQSFMPCVQAIVNLRDIDSVECGGTILVPGSHRTLASWMKQKFPSPSSVGPMQFKLSHADPLWSLVQHLTLRAGSMIVWDQRVFHGSTPNLSCDTRAGIPIKAFPARLLEDDHMRARERALAIERAMQEVNFEPSDLGKLVFGLHWKQPQQNIKQKKKFK